MDAQPADVRMAEARAALKRHWGFDELRPMQAKAVRAAFEGKDALIVLPTGGGKSLCYQLPAVVMNGTALVISPLVALMEDQVTRLNEAGVPAAYLNSTLSGAELRGRMAEAAEGAYKLVYVAPERLSSKFFQDLARKMRPGLIAVDEAHCVSQWGHDFRPAYRKIAALRQWAPGAVWMALTASATPSVRKDILANLQLADPAVIQASFQRSNIHYAVVKTERKSDQLLEVLPATGSGIIYVNKRRTVAELTRLLQLRQVSCGGFHAGLAPEEKKQRLREWLSGETRVIIATEAFGMGVDKAEVRFVIHFDPPVSPESYYQQTGRAGRDGLPSQAVCLYKYTDMAREEINLKRRTLAWKDVKTVQKLMRAQLSTAKPGAQTALSPEDFLAMLKNSARFSRRSPAELRQLLTFFGRTGDLNYLTTKESGNVRFIEIEVITQIPGDANQLAPYLRTLLAEIAELVRSNNNRLDIRTLANRLALSRRETELAFQALQSAGAVRFSANEPARQIEIQPRQTPVRALKRRFQTERKAFKQRQKRLYDTQTLLANEKNCINAMLLEYFGEFTKDNCGRCSNCLSKAAIPSSLTEIKREIKAVSSESKALLPYAEDFSTDAEFQRTGVSGTKFARRAADYLLKKERLVVRKGALLARKFFRA